MLRITAALAAAVVVWTAAALPPAQRRADPASGDTAIAGAFHVHSDRSDGRSSPEVIAGAAARAGLKFVVFTDHGDATRQPDPPTYRSGVLCIDAVEISTDDGHLIALGLAAAPYRLAGEGRDVVEDVHRLGGAAIAAHPDSPRDALRWRDWNASLDGFEVMNLDTVWRRHLEPIGWRTPFVVIHDLTSYLIRPGSTMAAMVSASAGSSEPWEQLAGRRRLALFGGVDAHSKLDLQNSEPEAGGWSLSLPGYEEVFRTLTMRLAVTEGLTGDPGRDAERVLTALREGRGYAALEAVLAPPGFEYFARAGETRIDAGQEIRATEPLSFTIRTNAPPTFTTTIWRGGDVFASQPSSPEWVVSAPLEPGAYRVVIDASDWPARPTWIASNAIFVRGPEAEASPPAAAIDASPSSPGGIADDPPGVPIPPDRWSSESSEQSKVALDVGVVDGRAELRVRFGLPSGNVRDEYVAATADLPEALTGRRAVSFAARSARPMRVSVQLRASALPQAPRWRRSVYVDDTWRSYVLDFDDFRAVGAAPVPRPPLADVRSLLFVVDQVNTAAGTSGRLWFADMALR